MYLNFLKKDAFYHQHSYSQPKHKNKEDFYSKNRKNIKNNYKYTILVETQYTYHDRMIICKNIHLYKPYQQFFLNASNIRLSKTKWTKKMESIGK